MKTEIYINGLSSCSALGQHEDEIWQNYLDKRQFLSKNTNKNWVAKLDSSVEMQITELRKSNKNYKKLDKSVLMAMLCSENLVKNQKPDTQQFGINFGSSRGATESFENCHEHFQNKQKAPLLSSPITTLGNVSSWVSQHLGSQGAVFSHSVTCSTSMHALLNGVAWMQGGLAESFIVGGSEAPLTDFTLAQMKSLQIYADDEITDHDYPCRALDLEKHKNSMVLGESAIALMLSKAKESALAQIAGIGFANEKLEHPTSLSANALCLQKSMQMALAGYEAEAVDIIITHTPGTLHGDQAEMRAIDSIFTSRKPAITTNKWKIGHTLGSSGLMSVELALLMMKHKNFIPVPYLKQQKTPEKFNNILINSVGFGGNAVSVLLTKTRWGH